MIARQEIVAILIKTLRFFDQFQIALMTSQQRVSGRVLDRRQSAMMIGVGMHRDDDIDLRWIEPDFLQIGEDRCFRRRCHSRI